jgi:hypothetical protein
VPEFLASHLAIAMDKLRSSNNLPRWANHEAIDLQWQISDQLFYQEIAVRSD